MDINICAPKLSGTIAIKASKSVMHRALICAALSEGISLLKNCYISHDITATMEILTKLGATFSVVGDNIKVCGIAKKPITDNLILNANESGSTIRFLIPIAAALGYDAIFTGENRLKTRPLDIYKEVLGENGVSVDYDGELPFTVSGKLCANNFPMHGNISSQFISGMLFALPLLNGDSSVEVIPPFESRGYVDITCDVLQQFGVTINSHENTYSLQGNQSYNACDYTVEGDYSQAAFFLVANCLGAKLNITNLNENSLQGDKQILDILKNIGVDISFINGTVKTNCTKLQSFDIDAANIPDLVPILCVLASFCDGVSTIKNVERLKIKESDRIKSSLELINALGGCASYDGEAITIHPCTEFSGGVIDTQNDHRIAMSAAIASIKSTAPVIIKGAECVNKSYPDFFTDIKMLGGVFDVINME